MPHSLRAEGAGLGLRPHYYVSEGLDLPPVLWDGDASKHSEPFGRVSEIHVTKQCNRGTGFYNCLAFSASGGAREVGRWGKEGYLGWRWHSGQHLG